MILAIVSPVAIVLHWTISGLVAGGASLIGFFIAGYLVWYEEYKRTNPIRLSVSRAGPLEDSTSPGSIYVHLMAKNSTAVTAKQCVVELTGISKKIDGVWRKQSMTRVALTWKGKELNKPIAQDVYDSKPFDLGCIRQDLGVFTPAFDHARLNFGLLDRGGRIRYYISITGDGARMKDNKEAVVEVFWDGVYLQNADEMKNHFQYDLVDYDKAEAETLPPA